MIKRLITALTLLVAGAVLHADTIYSVTLSDPSEFTVSVEDAAGFAYSVVVKTSNLDPAQAAMVAAAFTEIDTAITPEGATIELITLTPARDAAKTLVDLVGYAKFSKDGKYKVQPTEPGALTPATKASILALWAGLEALTEAQLRALAL